MCIREHMTLGGISLLHITLLLRSLSSMPGLKRRETKLDVNAALFLRSYVGIIGFCNSAEQHCDRLARVRNTTIFVQQFDNLSCVNFFYGLRPEYFDIVDEIG